MIIRKLAAKILILILIAISIAPITTKAQESTDSTAKVKVQKIENSYGQKRRNGYKLGVYYGSCVFMHAAATPSNAISMKYDFGNKNTMLSLIELETSVMYSRVQFQYLKTPVIEFSNQLQISLPYGFSNKRSGKKYLRFSPYITFGLSVVYANPKLKHLSSRSGYSGYVYRHDILIQRRNPVITAAIPFGLGLKWIIRKKIEFQPATLFHLVFSDSIDGQLGYGDGFFMHGVAIFYRITSSKDKNGK